MAAALPRMLAAVEQLPTAVVVALRMVAVAAVLTVIAKISTLRKGWPPSKEAGLLLS
jgi:hypothetical protein